MDGKIYNIRVEVVSDDSQLLYEIVSTLDVDVFCCEDFDKGTAVVESFADSMDEAVHIRQKFIDVIRKSGVFSPLPLVDIRELYNDNWQDAWKEFFHTERISERIVIKPSWEDYTAKAEDVVVDIDPGMSFGTGNHPTTRLCLGFMDKLSREFSGATFLDVGCGSGILSIAAVKLGFKNIAAYDHEDLSVEIAKKNLKKNGVDNEVDVFRADAKTYVTSEKYDVVVANMLVHIVMDSAEAVTANVRRSPNARLILSGSMEYQYDALAEVYGNYGFIELASDVYDNWKSGVFCLSAC